MFVGVGLFGLLFFDMFVIIAAANEGAWKDFVLALTPVVFAFAFFFSDCWLTS